MKYTIVTPTVKEIYDSYSLISARMATSNISDSRSEVTQLFDNKGKLLQTSYPMLVTNNDYDKIAEGYKLN